MPPPPWTVGPCLALRCHQLSYPRDGAPARPPDRLRLGSAEQARKLAQVEAQVEAQPQEPPLARRELLHQAFEIVAHAVLLLAARRGAGERGKRRPRGGPGAAQRVHLGPDVESRAVPALSAPASDWAERVKRHRESLRVSQMVSVLCGPKAAAGRAPGRRPRGPGARAISTPTT